MTTVPPGARHAGTVVGFAPRLLRIRYPHGVYVTLAGYVDWVPYARALVDLPPADPELPGDRQRICDVLAANLAMSAAGDPLWQGEVPGATPDGWLWRHLPAARRVALLPAEAALAFRHAGGLALPPVTAAPPAASRAPAVSPPPAAAPTSAVPTPVAFTPAEPVPDTDLHRLEQDLPAALPSPYRRFLAGNGPARLDRPAICPGFGFLVDQSLLRVGQDRRHLLGSVGYLRKWWGDRFTDDLLAVARVQGGLLALRLTGQDAGSVWFWDADDPRDDDGYDAAVVTRDLLRRCADSFDGFLRRLVAVPEPWLDAAGALAAQGQACPVSEAGMGESLLARDRPPV